MPSYVSPKKNTAFIVYVRLVSRASRPQAQANPTLAGGDVTYSIDGATAVSLATLPTVTPAGGTRVKVSLSAAEMNGDNISIAFIDAAGAEWDDLHFTIQTTVSQIDDLATASALSAVSALISALPTVATLAAAVWAYASRSLTQTLEDIINTLTSSTDIEQIRGDTWAKSLIIGAITGYDKLWLTIKSDRNQPDADALLQFLQDSGVGADGLIVLNGATPVSSQGSLTITDATTGAIIINLASASSLQLAPGNYYYDFKTWVSATNTTTTIRRGVFIVADTVTDAIA